MLRQSVLLPLWLFLAGCTDFGVVPSEVNLLKLSVGQRSRYVRFAGTDYYASSQQNISFQPDTLVLEVTGEVGGGFVVGETFKGQTVEYFMVLDGEYLTISRPEPSFESLQLFEVLGWNRSLKLPLKIDGPQIHMVGWHTSLEYCECYGEGYLSNYQLLSSTYARANVVVDNRAMAGDGPGYTWIYSRESGIIRSSWVSWWPPNQAGGWALLK